VRIQQLLQLCVDQRRRPARNTRYDGSSTVAAGAGVACGTGSFALESRRYFVHSFGRSESLNEPWRTRVTLQVEEVCREEVDSTEYPSLDEDLVDAECWAAGYRNRTGAEHGLIFEYP